MRTISSTVLALGVEPPGDGDLSLGALAWASAVEGAGAGGGEAGAGALADRAAAAIVVDVRLLAAGLDEGVDLQRLVLVVCGDTCVANEHARSVPEGSDAGAAGTPLPER